MARRLRGPGGPDSVRRVQLEGREYVFRWRWLQRSSGWALDISDANGGLLAGGIPVVPNVGLLRDVRAGRDTLPPGELFVRDTRTTVASPTLEGLGSDVSRIVYMTEAEVAPESIAAVASPSVIDLGGGLGSDPA